MRPWLQLVLALLALSTASAQVIDRMAAVVNRHVVMESEVDQEARVEYLMAGKPLEKLTQPDTAAALDRLIDRSLLEQQVGKDVDVEPAPAEVAAELRQVRQQFPRAATLEGWNALLASYGVTERDIQDHLAAQLRVLRFIDLRFRGLVRVDRNAIETYYQQKFLPELRKRGAPEPPVTEVSSKIEKILTEQGIDEMLNHWLETLRSQARIEKMSSPQDTSIAGEVRQ